VRLAAILLASAALGACSGSLTVNLTDTPADNATSVIIDFTGIELHNTDGKTTTITFPSAERIDLMRLQNGVTELLAQSHTVPAGNYDWMQLEVLADKDTQGESSITLDTGAQYPLYIPSGPQTALKLLSPFTVKQGETTELIIEFDLRQSVTSTDGQNYVLAPALRLENQAEVGTISATIDLAALAGRQLGSAVPASQCQGGLFVFSGAAAEPQNGGGSSLVDFEPIANSATMQLSGTGTTQVSIPYLAQGSYTIAATCDYELYDPTAQPGQSGYRALHWTVQDDVSVNTNTTTTESLPSGSTSNIVN
jgi:hypothetical protein